MVSSVTNNRNVRENSTLELNFHRNPQGRTVITHQYERHPMRVSCPFYLEQNSDRRAYVYVRNNSPGLFGKDELNLILNLEESTQLYLTEQSAAKVHPMQQGAKATVNYQWSIGQQSMVEFVPEPIILYADSALQQRTKIAIHPTASLFWSDLILPGRLARGESYQFSYYDHCLEIYSDRGELWCKERMYLKGKDNLFSHRNLFASLPILGTAIAILPDVEIDLLKSSLDNLENHAPNNLIVAISILPREKGVLIKVLGDKTQRVKSYWESVINVLRKLNRQSPLPKVPK